MIPDRRVSAHYTVSDLRDRITESLNAAGKLPKDWTIDDLAPVDEFHIRGRVATTELATKVGLRADDDVLDVGSGIGGTARYLATQFGCRIYGVDLTEEFCRVARWLSAQLEMNASTSFGRARAPQLPFADQSFSVVWTQHVQMNIDDKAGFYRDIARVIRPRGRLAFHDIFAGPGGDPHFPVPWASESSLSSLIASDRVRELLEQLGFVFDHWEDQTEQSRQFFETARDQVRDPAAMPLGLHLVLGADAPTKFQHMFRNLEEGRITVVQAVAHLDTAP